jgi:hypothetical protein
MSKTIDENPIDDRSDKGGGGLNQEDEHTAEWHKKEKAKFNRERDKVLEEKEETPKKQTVPSPSATPLPRFPVPATTNAEALEKNKERTEELYKQYAKSDTAVTAFLGGTGKAAGGFFGKLEEELKKASAAIGAGDSLDNAAPAYARLLTMTLVHAFVAAVRLVQAGLMDAPGAHQKFKRLAAELQALDEDRTRLEDAVEADKKQSNVIQAKDGEQDADPPPSDDKVKDWQYRQLGEELAEQLAKPPAADKKSIDALIREAGGLTGAGKFVEHYGGIQGTLDTIEYIGGVDKATEFIKAQKKLKDSAISKTCAGEYLSPDKTPSLFGTSSTMSVVA